MLILGIETSCDETAAAVVEDGYAVRSSVIASQHNLHARFAGVVPEIASRAHVERILPVIDSALAGAGATLADLDAVAVGNRPGLVGSLLVGVAAAKSLAWSLAVPLVGVDHVHAHLYAGLLEHTDAASRARPDAAVDPGTASPAQTPRSPGSEPSSRLADPQSCYPALGLVVSGGHTAIYRCDSPIDPVRLGATIDDAMGEAFDKAATILGLPHPGGPRIDALASSPGADDRAHAFPVSRLEPGSLDLSFSGLKTAVLYAVRGVPGSEAERARARAPLTERERADIAASFQRAAVRSVVLKLERAHDALHAAAVPCRALLAGGGVTANTRLRRELRDFAARRGVRLVLPPMDLCVDNAAMIAGLGFHLLRAGRRSDLRLAAEPTTPR